jgi:hypothetical protein
MSMTDISERWYWDRRSRKALYPVEMDGEDTVTFVTVWHREEAEDALDSNAVVPTEDVSREDMDTTFDLLDSFRFPEVTAEDE